MRLVICPEVLGCHKLPVDEPIYAKLVNMTIALIGLCAVVLAILGYTVSRKKSIAPVTKSTIVSTTSAEPEMSTKLEASKEVNSSETTYSAIEVQRAALQILETAHIIATSTAIDTVIGRYEFLKTIIPELQGADWNDRYVSDVQSAVDQYKHMYYDRVPLDSMLGLVLAPRSFDIPQFYCVALSGAFLAQFKEHSEARKLLKRADAVRRRHEKLMEVLRVTMTEMERSCTGAELYPTAIQHLRDIQVAFGENSHTEESNFELLAADLEPKDRLQPIRTALVKSVSISGEFVLNRGSAFELTLINCDGTLGEKIKSILDEEGWDGRRIDLLVAEFAEHNLKVKEIETYVEKYKPMYQDCVEEIKASSAEWADSGDLDREDMLDKIRRQAISNLYELANCDLITLFEAEPKDVKIDDSLIKEYGYESIELYVRHAGSIDKVLKVPSDNTKRARFEQLVEQRLCIRGSDIGLSDLLMTLSLKELNELANYPKIIFRRKAQAVDYIVGLADATERLGSFISLRELFKLLPLPVQFGEIDLSEVSRTWEHIHVVVRLLVDTYRSSEMAGQDRFDWKFERGYHIECRRAHDEICPRSKTLFGKQYDKESRPNLPLHVGCNCILHANYGSRFL